MKGKKMCNRNKKLRSTAHWGYWSRSRVLSLVPELLPFSGGYYFGNLKFNKCTIN